MEHTMRKRKAINIQNKNRITCLAHLFYLIIMYFVFDSLLHPSTGHVIMLHDLAHFIAALPQTSYRIYWTLFNFEIVHSYNIHLDVANSFAKTDWDLQKDGYNVIWKLNLFIEYDDHYYYWLLAFNEFDEIFRFKLLATTNQSAAVNLWIYGLNNSF